MPDKTPTLKETLKTLTSARNITRTVAAAIPFAGPFLEIESQIANQQLVKRLAELEAAAPKESMPPGEWPIVVDAYMRRTVNFAVFYDGGEDSETKRGQDVFIAVAHGCLIGPGEVLTCTEALRFAQDVATAKRGRVVILIGFEEWQFDVETGSELCGLVTCRLIQRNEDRFAEFKEKIREAGLEAFYIEPLQTPITATVSPWIGQEIAFIHAGEVKDAWRFFGTTRLQFDTSVISHFRKPNEGTLKSFVSGVVAGRVLKAGSAVFTRSGILVGVISDVESFESDAGRRIIVKSLLGHRSFLGEVQRNKT